MAIATGTIHNIQTDGSDSANGGGFDPTNANMLSNGAVSSANTSAPVLSSASYTFLARDVDHWAFIKSGTNTIPGWYKIVSVAGGAATLSAAIGAAFLTNIAPNTALGCGNASSLFSVIFAIDYSRHTTGAVPVSFTDLVIDGTTNTKATSSANPIQQAWCGNIINVASGTGFTVQRVQLVSVASNAGTFDKSLGTLSSTGGTGKLGGPFASLGAACGAAAAGNAFTWKNGTYTASSTTNNVSGGRATLPANSGNVVSWIRGYATVPGDLGTKPIFKADGVITTFTLITGNIWALIENIEVDGNSRSGSTGIACGSNEMRVSRCNFKNLITAGCTSSTANSLSEYCYFYLCGGTVCSTAARYCVSIAHTSTPFTGGSSGGSIEWCIASKGTGASTDGFAPASSNATRTRHCISYKNPRDGFRSVASSDYFTDNISWGNTGNGYHATGTQSPGHLTNCAAGGNGTNFSSAVSSIGIGSITLTVDPFIDGDNGDFRLNSLAGGGALLRSLGYPINFPGISTPNNQDIGATQHQEGSGGYARGENQ